MPDEIQEQSEGAQPEDLGEDIHVLAQVLLHFHAKDNETAHSFTKQLLDEIAEFAENRVRETEGVFIPSPFGGELKEGDLELTDEDIQKLLNPEGTD